MNRIASRGQLRASFLRWALVLVPVVVLLGLLSGYAAGSGEGNPWFAALEKPALYPPPITFPVVWTALYVLMGLAFAMVCAAHGARWRGAAIIAFLVQFALNLSWSPVFFAEHRIGLAFWIVLAMLAATLVTIVLFARVRRAAAWLLVPYIAWISFAAGLNYEIWRLNPGADGAHETGAVQRIAI